MPWVNAVFAIAYGIFVSSLSFLFFFLLGASVLPTKTLKNWHFSFSFGLIGLMLFSIACFYGLQYDISLQTICQWIIVLFLVCLLFRVIIVIKLVKSPLHPPLLKGGTSPKIFCKGKIFALRLSLSLFPPFNKGGCRGDFTNFISFRTPLQYLLIYALLYTLTYIFLPQPDATHFIPITRIGNSDILNYANIEQNLFILKNSAMASSYLHPFGLSYDDRFWAYYLTPGIYYFFAWLSQFYDNNALNTAMPLLYTTVSLIGTLIAYYCHRFFYCSRWVSAGIAAIILCGSFYRFIIGFYFLSSLMGTVLFLACLITVLHQEKFSSKTILFLTAPLTLLLLFYPIFFWITLPILFIVITFRFFNNRCFLSLAFLLIAIGIVFLIFPQYIQTSIQILLWQSHRNETLWILPLLSPLSILGFPTYYGWLQPKLLLIPFVALLFGLFYCFHRVIAKMPNSKKMPVYILSILAISALFIYWLYYYCAGPLRYQPWKFASYFLVPLAGVFWAIFCKTLSQTKHYHKFFIAILIFCIGGNFFFYSFHFAPPLTKEYVRLSQLNALPEPIIATKMNNFAGTYLAKFFIREKMLYPLNYSSYSKQTLAKVSDDMPFFVESPYGCQFSDLSQKMTPIKPIGCLYYGIPLLAFNQHYYFSENLPFIDTHNLFEFFVASTSRASITFYVSNALLKQNPTGYFHVQVEPFIGKQRAIITWGANHKTTVTIDTQKWLNFSYISTDWKTMKASSSFKTLTFYFDFPDAKSPHDLNKNNEDRHPKSLNFIQFFMSVNSLPTPEFAKRIHAVGSGK